MSAVHLCRVCSQVTTAFFYSKPQSRKTIYPQSYYDYLKIQEICSRINQKEDMIDESCIFFPPKIAFWMQHSAGIDKDPPTPHSLPASL